MNIPRLILAIVAAYIVIFATDYFIHQIWLAPDYALAKGFLRPDADVTAHFQWIVAAQILCAVTFVLIWAMGFGGRSVATGIVFGLVLGMFQQIWVLVNYAILPMSGDLALKWYFSGLAQAILIGMVSALIYRPRAAIG
jgi:hypothetical protein